MPKYAIIVTKVINQIFVHNENSAKLARLGSGSGLDKWKISKYIVYLRALKSKSLFWTLEPMQC